MAISWLQRLLKKSRPLSRPVRKTGQRGRSLPWVEPLDERVLPAVTATFSATGALLRVVGDELDNAIVVSRDAAGTILVNGGAVAIQGDAPVTVANAQMIMLVGAGGNDTLSLDETNGVMPAGSFFGGAGNDVLIGGSGNDFVDGGAGSDAAFLGAGDDTFQWNPGDGSDTVEGQGFRDTLVFNGSDVAEKFDLTANGNRVRFTRDLGNVTMDLKGVEVIDVNAFGGIDAITINDQTATDLFDVNLDLNGTDGQGDGEADVVTINGTDGDDFGQIASFNGTSISANVSWFPLVTITGAEGALDNLKVNALGGNDEVDASFLPANLIVLSVTGGAGNDHILGSQGSDIVNGGTGADVVRMGAGTDSFVWNPGDGSDTVEGEAGSDWLVFNGSDVAEKFDFSAIGSRVWFTRDVGNVTMDLNGIETIQLNALGGADTITVRDQAATDLATLNLNLKNSTGDGDGQADSVSIDGTEGDDKLQVASLTSGIRLADGAGLVPVTTISGIEGTSDHLTVNALGGNDTVDATGLVAGAIGLTINGGANDDQLFGSQGNDLVNGGAGTDVAFLGAGDDTFVWNPGDGSDIVEGQTGRDALIFNGSNNNERIDLFANGQRVWFTRDVGTIAMDLNDVERVDFNALGGTDAITISDLSGTDVTEVNLSLAATLDGTAGDAQPDSVVVDGTNGADLIPVLGTDGGILVNGDFLNGGGLPAFVLIRAVEATDTLRINGKGGDDHIDATGLATAVLFSADGGVGNDTLSGSPGADTLLGGAGNDFIDGNGGRDVASLGAGNDTFQWDPGDGSDIVDGQDGSDRLVFNGSDLAENFNLSSIGNHAWFTRDLGNITMDLDGIEILDLNARGGADVVSINDQTSTDLVQVNLNLALAIGGGDTQADSVIVNGSDQDDAIQITAVGNGTSIVVGGLFPVVNIAGAEGTNDHLTVNARGGNDAVDASGLTANLIGLTVNLGEGQETPATATTTTLHTATATAVVGQSVVLTATVDAAVGTPTGIVTFLEGNTVLGSVAVDATGQATLTVTPGVGNHTLTASFTANGGFADSSSAPASLTISRAATNVALASSVKAAVIGQAVTFTATVTPVAPGASTPTGTVTFADGDVILQTVAVAAGGKATFTTTFAVARGHAITATYNGDQNFVSSSQGLTEEVNAPNPTATATTLHASTATAVVGQTIVLTATVNALAGAPTGTVTFLDGTTVLGSAPINGGQATLTVSLDVGNHTLTASFAGTGGFAASGSAAVTENVILPDANSRFVDQLYQELLSRPSDPDGLAFWTSLLARGIARTQIVAGITSSVEYDTAVVQQAYQHFLQRGADQAGLTFWVTSLQTGMKIEEMQAGILGSAEYFQSRGNRDNAGFLPALYQDALGRAIDAAGQDFFTRLLAAGTSRAQVASAILASAEFQQNLVTSAYRQFLDRSPDDAGLAFFINALKNGQTDQQIAATIAASDEFFARL